MTPFKDVSIAWDGVTYTIPAKRVLTCVAMVEDVLTLDELFKFIGARNTVPFAKLARAFGIMLRYAGAKMTDDEIFAGMLDGMSQEEKQQAAMHGVQTLLMMMLPPKHLQMLEEGDAKPAGKEPAASSQNSSSSAAGSAD